MRLICANMHGLEKRIRSAMNVLTSGLDALFASNNKFVKQFSNWGLRQLNRQGSDQKIINTTGSCLSYLIERIHNA
jgi:hypothetical protein